MANNKLIAKKNKIIKLKLAMEKLQRSLQLGKKLSTWSTTTSDVDDLHDNEVEEEPWVEEDSSLVPQDVKEGHFAVVAVDEDYGLAKRFVVPLRYLNHPMFVALLEHAAEKYGFDYGGALTVPCRPSDMERILAERWEEERGYGKVNNGYSLSCNNVMLESC